MVTADRISLISFKDPIEQVRNIKTVLAAISYPHSLESKLRQLTTGIIIDVNAMPSASGCFSSTFHTYVFNGQAVSVTGSR